MQFKNEIEIIANNVGELMTLGAVPNAPIPCIIIGYLIQKSAISGEDELYIVCNKQKDNNIKFPSKQLEQCTILYKDDNMDLNRCVIIPYGCLRVKKGKIKTAFLKEK